MKLDAVARLLLDEAGPLSGKVLVLGDVAGALTSAALAAGCQVRAFCDDVRDAAALPPGTALPTPHDPFVRDAELVLLRLPKSLGALEDACQWIAASPPAEPGEAPPADPVEARLVAGGRVKHMTTSQNDVLGRYFGSVRASRGRDKCRVLHAAGPLGTPPRWPRSRAVAGLTVWSHGGVFGGGRLDAGTALLLDALDRGLSSPDDPRRLSSPDDPRRLSGPRGTSGRVEAPRALDLGCGSGILATWLALRGWSVSASDVSWVAVDSTRRTAAANGVHVDVAQRDGLAGVPDHSLELIVTNPPFHRGAAKDSTPTFEAIAAAGAALAPGGEFWCVFNSHLPYLPALRRHIGRTDVVARDRSYTVARAAAPAP